MKKDFIVIDGQQYRVEVNMNTAENWEHISGRKLGQFEIEAAESANTGGVATRDMLYWLFCALQEGEELEGREFTPDFMEFKRMVKPSIVSQFAIIFIKQYLGSFQDNQPIAQEEKKKKQIRSRLAKFSRLLWVIFAGVILISLAVVVRFFGSH